MQCLCMITVKVRNIVPAQTLSFVGFRIQGGRGGGLHVDYGGSKPQHYIGQTKTKVMIGTLTDSQMTGWTCIEVRPIASVCFNWNTIQHMHSVYRS